jgi:putative transposase
VISGADAHNVGRSKKGGQHLFQERWKIFQFIKENDSLFPIEKMCKVMKVSVSGFYYWLKQPVSSRTVKEQALLTDIHKIYNSSKKRYGSPRITVELREQGIQVSRPRVARLMKKANIKSIIRRKYRVQTTDSKHDYAVSENHLNREFAAQTIGQKWVSDLTYIRTGEGWLYLTAILDLADRKVVGWAMSDTMKAADTTIAAWKMAIINRPVSQYLIFHSDRGVQYACTDFREQLKGIPVLQSMSRKGNCWDNAIAESFFKTLKAELVYHDYYATKEQAKLAIFEYIECWYNKKRRHSAIGNRSPEQYLFYLQEKRIAA